VKVLAAMSGGVDSSVAAALLVEQGHDVTGVTLRLWGGASDSGCCSVADVEDARRVAQQLGIPHYVFNFGDDFAARVVTPYVAAHATGTTPNPCVECNRHIKFDRLLARSDALGFDAVATGHHARIGGPPGRRRLVRGADAAKDQSYVLYMLGQAQLARCLFPVGALTKADVRAHAARLGLRTAAKPDSQDVCFVTTHAGRGGFLDGRVELHPARVVDTAGNPLGEVPAVELVTVGQRRGLGVAGAGGRRYAVEVDVPGRAVVVGTEDELRTESTALRDLCWVDGPVDGPVLAQTSAHGRARPAAFAAGVLHWDEPERRVAPGQSVVLYDGDAVLGGGIAA
jgi:tRNA-specific 2-thiouridylase